MRYTLHIEGMSCMGCVRTVSKIIERHGGRVEVVSLEEKKAVFDIDTSQKIDDIVRDIESKGYRVTKRVMGD